MATLERKRRICEENKTLLKLIYFFGKGVMQRQHILRYFKYFEGKNEIETSKKIKELEVNELIDSHNFFGSKVIKLKKFVVYFLLGKNREDVASITFTAGKVKKSTFLNQILLKNADFLQKRFKTLEDLINYYVKKTTYFSKEKESYLYLQQMLDKNLTEEYAAAEISLLKDKQRRSHNFKTKEVEKEGNKFNLNSMLASNIYIGLGRKLENNKICIYVDILDLSGVMTGKKLSEKINKTIDCLNSLFLREKVDFKFVLHVQSLERKGVLEKQNKQVATDLYRHCREEVFWEVNNLDLEKTIFRNQKILLNV